ncbi:MAG: undecaprenyl-phosphate glucose phosphotransferase [Acidimicrobiaceae bacterium]|nr:undecaprenyl-phosphate glucose phosphotransferase [Acidimicrobiaceae bacterium]
MSKAETVPETAESDNSAAAPARVVTESRQRPQASAGARRLRALRVASDLVMALLAVPLVYWVRFHVYPHYIPGGEPPDPQRYIAAAPVLPLTVVAVFAFMNVYRWRRGVEFIDELFSVVRAMLVVGVVGLAEIGAYRAGSFTYSRLTFFYWLIAATALILLARYALRIYQERLRVHGDAVDRALVVGASAAADLVIQRIRMFPDYGFQLVGVVADELRAGTSIGGVDVVGRTAELRQVVEEHNVDQVFIASPDLSHDRILRLVESCRDQPVEFRIVPSMLEIMTSRVVSDQLDGIPLLQFRRSLEMSGTQATLKRTFDLVVGGLCLMIALPVMAVVALLIRLTSAGPVVLRQARVGLNEHRFDMLKFRSMRKDAEAKTGPVWASADDGRRTRLGRFLRRFSLDELPQLWNVVRGDMSLVGPRPERPVFVEQFKSTFDGYGDRHRTRPGLTGWAQVNDLRGHTPVEERLIYDLYYIENWSLAFDVKIILITLVRVFTHKNAY